MKLVTLRSGAIYFKVRITICNNKMNFAKTRDYSKPRLIETGDLVIVYEKHNSLDYLFLGGAIDIYNNKFGSFHHSDIIGRHFGCKVHSRSSSGYVYILEPTPELWANALNVLL